MNGCDPKSAGCDHLACRKTHRNATLTYLFLAKPWGQHPTPPGALHGAWTSFGAELTVRSPALCLAGHKALAQGETCKGSEKKHWACQPAQSAQNGAHAWNNLSCTALGCRSRVSALILSKAPLICRGFLI